MEKTKEIYSSIDIAKFIFSVCIVILHTEVYKLLPYNLSYFIEKGVLRLAVPFFFCVSGFLIGEKIFLSSHIEYKVVVRKYIFRLLKYLVIFESINIVLEVIKMSMQGIVMHKILTDILKHICFYPYGALWYIQASIIGIMLAYPFISRGRVNWALLIGSFGYIFALLSNNYYFLLNHQLANLKIYIDNYLSMFITARNGIFVGFFLITLGIKTHELYIKKIFIKKLFPGIFVLFFLLYIFEIKQLSNLYFSDDGALYLTHILVIPALVLGLVNCKFQSMKTTILRKLSIGIYLLHRIIISILYIMDMKIGGFNSVWNKFVIVLGSCIIICLFIYKGVDKMRSCL